MIYIETSEAERRTSKEHDPTPNDMYSLIAYQCSVLFSGCSVMFWSHRQRQLWGHNVIGGLLCYQYQYLYQYQYQYHLPLYTSTTLGDTTQCYRWPAMLLPAPLSRLVGRSWHHHQQHQQQQQHQQYPHHQQQQQYGGHNVILLLPSACGKISVRFEPRPSDASQHTRYLVVFQWTPGVSICGEPS